MKPAHEVMDPSPELERVILNFGPLDYLTIGAFTFFNAAGGYAYGACAPRRSPRDARARPTAAPPQAAC